MKYSLCIAALAMCATEVVAFPSRMFDIGLSEEGKGELSGMAATIEAEAKMEKRFGTTTFNATAQYISTTGTIHLSPRHPMI
jgi:hypothetical protein